MEAAARNSTIGSGSLPAALGGKQIGSLSGIAQHLQQHLRRLFEQRHSVAQIGGVIGDGTADLEATAERPSVGQAPGALVPGAIGRTPAPLVLLGITRFDPAVDSSLACSMTSKGQVTIPKALRQQLGLGRGSRICFELVGDHKGRPCKWCNSGGSAPA